MEDIKIIYEDESVVAVNKLVGVLVHPTLTSTEPTLLDWLKERWPEARLAHRLDRETSGVILAAKNEVAYEFLKKQFQDRLVQKEYRAIVVGAPKADSGTVDKPIGRSPRAGSLRLAGRGAKGPLREAVTHWQVLERLNGLTYLALRPETGRTHQLRVHLKYLNLPILGDKLYGGRPADRLYLHALALSLTLPGGLPVKLETDLPPEFESVRVNQQL